MLKKDSIFEDIDSNRLVFQSKHLYGIDILVTYYAVGEITSSVILFQRFIKNNNCQWGNPPFLAG